MNARKIIGRKIVGVRQGRVKLPSGESPTVVFSITLDNGALLCVHAYLTDDDPVGDVSYLKPSSPNKADMPSGR